MEKATQAREENIIANELEQIKLAITNAMAQGLDGKVSDVNLKNALQGIIDDEELENITGDGPWTITTKLKKTYEINGYGQIEETVVLEPTDIYVALDGTTLRFYNNKDNVPQNLLSNLYSYENETENFKGVDFTETNKNPWYKNNDKAKITKVVFEDIIVPTSTKRWFVSCSGLTEIDNIHNLKTKFVTDMNRMFYGCSSLTELDVSKWDTSKVENMGSMFYGDSGLTELDVSKWDTSNVENMSFMFGGCSGLTELDVSNWNTSKVTDMFSMFSGCSNLITIYVGDKWNTNAVTRGGYMFENCNNLIGGEGTTYGSATDWTNETKAKVDGGPSSPGYFTHINDKVTN